MKLAITFLSIITNVLLFNIAYCATYYMPDNFSNLRAAAAGMNSGDTLIIRDGVYSGTDNVLDALHLPPSGVSSTQYTIIKAENDGGAIFPNSFLNMLGTRNRQYIQFEGLKAESQTNVIGWNHCRFLRCAFTHYPSHQTDDPVFGLIESSYILVEDCWAWGAGRYKFLAYSHYDPTSTHHIVFRRCVVRYDRVNAYSPAAAFSVYHANQVALQNCIVIDGDHDEFWVAYEERAGAFYSHHGSQDTLINGCIVLNHKSYAAGGAPNSGFSINNLSAWNAAGAVWTRNDQGLQSGFPVNRLTAGHMRSVTGVRDLSVKGVQCYSGSSSSVPVTNSIFYDIATSAIDGIEPVSDYNVFYANSSNYSASGGPAGSHDYASENSNAVDPLDGNPGNDISGLKFLVKTEDGSNLKGTGSDGGDRGANIMFRIGVSGSYWGDTGWDTTTSEPLWPWPNETRIKYDMRAYSYTGPIVGGGTATLSGNRGFCAAPSLTTYIWEYLGNTIPEDIYAGIDIPQDPDTPPDVVNFTAIAGNGQVNLSWRNPTQGDYNGVMIRYRTDTYPQNYQDGTFLYETNGQPDGLSNSYTHNGAINSTTYYYSAFSRDSSGNYSNTAHASATPTISSPSTDPTTTLQDFEDEVLWQVGGNQDAAGYGRGWQFTSAGTGDTVSIDNTIGANGTNSSLKVTFASDNSAQIYFRSPDKASDYMPEAAGANRISFYVRFPADFPIQPLPFRYDTWQFGTYMHDPDDYSDTHAATSEDDHGIHHYYHRVTIEKAGPGWVKYIFNTQPDAANYSGSTVPPNYGTEYYDNYGRFYFHFGSEAGGPEPARPFTIWIDEIKFYYDDGSIGGQIHTGGQDDAGFDGQFFREIPRKLRMAN